MKKSTKKLNILKKQTKVKKTNPKTNKANIIYPLNISFKTRKIAFFNHLMGQKSSPN